MDTLQTISVGDTKALIYALCIAVVTLAVVIVWLAFQLLKAYRALGTVRDVYGKELGIVRDHWRQTERECADSKEQLHRIHSDEIKRIQEARIEEMADVTHAAEALRKAIDIILTHREPRP